MASNLLAMVSNLMAMASNLLLMASNLLAMASNLIAMASNLLAMASNLLATSDGLLPNGVQSLVCSKSSLLSLPFICRSSFVGVWEHLSSTVSATFGEKRF